MSAEITTPEIDRAIEELEDGFPGRVVVEARDESGLIVRIREVPLSERWAPGVGDLWFVMLFDYPDAPIYPHYVTGAQPTAGIILGAAERQLARHERDPGLAAPQRMEPGPRHRRWVRDGHYLLAARDMNELRISEQDYRRLQDHLFQPDRDEHGAILLAGQRQSREGITLTVRELHILRPDDFPPGEHGYRQLSAAALARLGNRAADEGLALVSAHSHPVSDDRTGLSRDDLDAHERIFSHLLDITDAHAVCGVAFGKRSAGEVWRRDGQRAPLDRVRVVGSNVRLVSAAPNDVAETQADLRFDRQVRLFGATGQARLREMHVGVIGVGGGGSILVEQLAKLGVGRLSAVDFDVVKLHNLSRIMGAGIGDCNFFQRNLNPPLPAGRGINISGVDFWHAVEFSRNGRFLRTHPLGLSSGRFPSAFRVSNSIRLFRSP